MGEYCPMNYTRILLHFIVLAIIIAELSQSGALEISRRKKKSRKKKGLTSRRLRTGKGLRSGKLRTIRGGRQRAQRAQRARSRAQKRKAQRREKKEMKDSVKRTPVVVEFDKMFKLPPTGCGCAKVEEDDTSQWERDHRRRNKRSVTANDRIVNGYTVKKNKPWVARIWFKKKELLCGGSLINKRYVLTAGHCICKTDAGLSCSKDGVPTYRYRGDVGIYLGVNDKKVNYLNTDLLEDKRYEYGVDWGLAHPKYIELQEQTYDIGMWKLDVDARMTRFITQPICLPHTFDMSDVVRPGNDFPVYTSGWGRLFSSCITNELGPVKSLKCQFPFNSGQSQENSCARKLTPSSKDEDCKDFRKKEKEKYPKSPGEVVAIYNPEKNVTKHCHYRGAENGWCETIGNKGWGWCDSNCKYKEGSKEFEENVLATALQETKLSLLPMKHCKKLITA